MHQLGFFLFIIIIADVVVVIYQCLMLAFQSAFKE